MVNRIGTAYRRVSNRTFSSRFSVNSQIPHETPEEGRNVYRLKRYEYDYKAVSIIRIF